MLGSSQGSSCSDGELSLAPLVSLPALGQNLLELQAAARQCQRAPKPTLPQEKPHTAETLQVGA